MISQEPRGGLEISERLVRSPGKQQQGLETPNVDLGIDYLLNCLIFQDSEIEKPGIVQGVQMLWEPQRSASVLKFLFVVLSIHSPGILELPWCQSNLTNLFTCTPYNLAM